MKKILISLILLATFFCSCQKNEPMKYEGHPSLYMEQIQFNFQDSLQYSFIVSGQEVDTLYLQVSLLGVIHEDKSFIVEVADSSTAIADVHYKALEESYLFEAGNPVQLVPIIIYKTDDMAENIYSLYFNLVENKNFKLPYTDKTSYQWNITNQFIKPSYWSPIFDVYFGPYSLRKHEIAFEIMGHDFPFTKSEVYNYHPDYPGYAYFQAMGRKVCEYIVDNYPVYDENGDVMEPWDCL